MDSVNGESPRPKWPPPTISLGKKVDAGPISSLWVQAKPDLMDLPVSSILGEQRVQSPDERRRAAVRAMTFSVNPPRMSSRAGLLRRAREPGRRRAAVHRSRPCEWLSRHLHLRRLARTSVGQQHTGTSAVHDGAMATPTSPSRTKFASAEYSMAVGQQAEFASRKDRLTTLADRPGRRSAIADRSTVAVQRLLSEGQGR
jgi:hypothetical protein